MSNNPQTGTPAALAPHAAVVIVPSDLLARFILDAVQLTGRILKGAASAVRRSPANGHSMAAPVALVMAPSNFIADAIRPW